MSLAANPDLPPLWGPVLERVRDALAESLRSQVAGAGDDRAERARAIFEAPGPRWFTPQDPISRVHSDASMFTGGLRALLLQSLHPVVMQGFAEHTSYKDDPLGRLHRTSAFLASTTFGTVEVAEQQVRIVRAIHGRVRGTLPDGTQYCAGDPHLLGWVHATEAESFLVAFQRHATTPLTPAEADLYVRQLGSVSARLGVVDPPQTVAELEATIRAYRPELRSTPEAREGARWLLLRPPFPLASRPGYAALAAGAVAMLPWWARLPLRLPWLPVTERLVNHPVGGAATSVVRWAMTAPGDPHPRA